MSSTLEIGRSTYLKAEHEGFPPPLDGRKMFDLWYRYVSKYLRKTTKQYGFDSFKQQSIMYFSQFIEETDFVSAGEYVNLYILLYWEHRMSAWLGVANAERDFYSEPLVPFNARAILTALLGVSRDERNAATVFYEAIRQTTPSLLDIPINPTKWP